MQLYLVRHGQSEGNIATYDIPDGHLTPLGLAQAEQVAQRLQGEGIDLLIASPLRRALQTADALRRRTGAPLEVWRDLSEARRETPHRFLGRQGVQELCPGALCEEDLPDDGFDLGDEADAHTLARAQRSFARVCTRFAHTDQKVAIFAHGVFNHFFLATAMQAAVRPGYWVEQWNCCVNRLRITRGEVRVLAINETWHLTDPTP